MTQMTNTLPNPLFVFELANNHMGSVSHGEIVIATFGAIARRYPWRFAFKLQYRDLDTFIHPAFRARHDVKYVKRFQDTRLATADLARLVACMRDNGFTAVCTPFDEPSVDLIDAHGFDAIKIASCSLTDWLLLERIVRSSKPVIASTAGATLEEIDSVVSFFEHREKELAVMHCVAAYPTRDQDLQLNQIDLLRTRYPRLRVGYSTHESPHNLHAVRVAIGKGATLFEKHVGVATERWPLNEYSAGPEQVERWLDAAAEAYDMCGATGGRNEAPAGETESLRSLRRGAFARKALPAGETVAADQVFFAFPATPGQVTANEWSKYARFDVTDDVNAGAALMTSNTRRTDTRQQVYEIIQSVKSFLREGHIVVPGKADLEISHHYGLERFSQFGLVMITVVNREYCKKLIAMLPGQTHPEQHHKLKEETFLVLHGDMVVTLDDVERELGPGDLITVHRGVRHLFRTAGGVIFEEISSTHHKDDSYYTDASIGANRNRKTCLTYWMG
jgi:sialic acid synthase SpsE/quercetin dioxygenase-like cupin family protein